MTKLCVCVCVKDGVTKLCVPDFLHCVKEGVKVVCERCVTKRCVKEGV